MADANDVQNDGGPMAAFRPIHAPGLVRTITRGNYNAQIRSGVYLRVDDHPYSAVKRLKEACMRYLCPESVVLLASAFALRVAPLVGWHALSDTSAFPRIPRLVRRPSLR